MRVTEAAKELGISTRHVFRLVEQRKLSGRKVVVRVPVKVTSKEVLEIEPSSVQALKPTMNRRKN